MKELIKRKGNTNTENGFNFNYTCYGTLKDNWYEFSKSNRYDHLYVSESGNRAHTLNELRKLEENQS